ncbi:hypothetical protein FA048_07400 [Pedobacter polaris]|uniref:PorV/PorQ family protein n=1 Tax=Pedobacter polaris TaxID=2571273 RepID=A0A4U1CRD5_9SPHI|nr:hypothetical protein [Pedobacter polaris]TKC10026.1 hypothetical protein FA048_07400 [Pedobacter polaris]
MNKIFNLSLMLFLSITPCLAQINFGPRLSAMGNNGSAIQDIWSVEANPSGITGITTPIIALNYSKYLVDSELSKQAISFVLPVKNNFIGTSFQRYGISEYNEIKAGIALAKKFGDKLSIALKGNYHQIKISNYGASTGFSVDVGAMYHLNKQLTLGVYINNPSFQKYSSKAIETVIPTIIHVGASYKASDKLLIATTISKDMNAVVDVSLGIDYKLLEILSLRAGLTAKPFKQYGGFGINYKKLLLDFAIETNAYQGYTPQISLAYVF